MTDADRQAFAQAFNRLAVAVRLPADEGDAAMKQIYWEGLADLSVEHVLGAATELQRGQWFPKLGEWREAAGRQCIAAIKALPLGREHPWVDECAACRDTGWEHKVCYGGTVNTCGRHKCEAEGAPEHPYVYPCTCRPTNRTFSRHHKLPPGQEVYAG